MGFSPSLRHTGTVPAPGQPAVLESWWAGSRRELSRAGGTSMQRPSRLSSMGGPPASACISPCAHSGQGRRCYFVAFRRFKDNPWVTEKPNFRFYASAPLVSTTGGHRYGTL